MSDWLHNLPIFWMTFVVFGFTYLVAAEVYGLVKILAKGERAHAFKAIAPGMLTPLYNRIASAVDMGLLATGVAASVLLIAAPGSAIHGRDLSWARAASAGHAKR